MSFSVLSALRWWSRECPDHPAVSFHGDTLTFGEVWAWSARIADHLSRHENVRPGDRVAMVATNALDYAMLALGLVHVGAIGTPWSFRSPARELAVADADFAPVLVFTDADRRAAAAEALGEAGSHRLRPLSDVAALRRGQPAASDRMAEPGEIIFVVGTSGSTAKPKGVPYTHAMVMSYASEFALMEPLCAHGASVLSMGPFSSTSGYLLLMQFLAMGVTIYLEPSFEPADALRRLVERRITTFQAAPIFFERIAALDAFQGADLSALRFGQVGGARVSPQLQKAWKDKGVVLRQAYGCTEAGGAWAARDDTALERPERAGRGGLFTDYAIAREDGTRAAPGETGEILIKGPSVLSGYYNNAEATAAALEDGWLHTGDLGFLDETGALQFVDRKKDIIISGGLNISALEVEAVIAELPGVREVAVIAVGDARFGETPLAVIYGDPAELDVGAIIAHCDRELSNYKVPRYVVISDEPLPRLLIGKIAKPVLRERYRNAESEREKVR